MTTSSSLVGKIAMVTGATSGLGYRFCVLLASRGCNVMMLARKPPLPSLVESVSRASFGQGSAPNVLFKSLDVAQKNCGQEAVALCLSEFSRPPDILCNSAGIALLHRTSLNKQPPLEGEAGEAEDLRWTDQLRQTMEVNVYGTAAMSRAVARAMLLHKGKGEGKPPPTSGEAAGSIINISSVAGDHVLRGLAAYSVSKTAVNMLTKSFALELAGTGIAVNAISPGYIATSMNEGIEQSASGRKFIDSFPRKRVGKPEDLDDLFLLLASNPRFITGSVFTADDGQFL